MHRSFLVLLAGAVLLCGGGLATAATSFVAFESGPVRPLALSPDGTRLFVCNTPDNTLEIFDVGGPAVTHVGSVPVGMEPVAVAARTDDEVWVVNHLSDSVSVVDVSGPPQVVRTLLVGDEPQDVVFAGPGGTRAFVSAAHRGQSAPDPRGAFDVPGVGRADVWVFDALALGSGVGGTPLAIVTLFGDKPRALAVSPDGATVYAAVFRSGNRTTTIHEALVCDTSPANLAAGTVEGPCVATGTAVPGGLPPPHRSREAATRPETGLIVRQDRDGGTSGAWQDELGRDWSAAVRFDLPDLDVFAIDVGADPPVVTDAFPHVGTLLFNMTTNPVSGALYVSNTEARNEVRFEGPGALAGPVKPPGEPASVRGRVAEARITVIPPGGPAQPRHLNKHLDYAAVPQPPAAAARSLATPLQMAVSPDGATLYVAAFGSAKIGVFATAELEADTFVPDASRHIALGAGGPAGLVLQGTRLFVLTRFDDALAVVDLTAGTVGVEVQRLPLHNPEPAHVVVGRPFLYDARATGSNGEASCAGCHPFGDMDDLAWDLGNPDGVVVPNGNPLATGAPTPFHPMKGPMVTQSLRGLANAGPQHWRGDRQGDAIAAFNAFNVAFPELVGRDEGEIAAAGMQAFTDFAMALTYPPSPIRQLDGALRPDEEAGLEVFDGPTSDTTGSCNVCHVIAPHAGFFGTDGRSADQTSPIEFKTPHLRNGYQKIGMFGMARIPRVPAEGDFTHQGPQVRGFGFFHDGSFDSMFRFLELNVFDLNPAREHDVEAFMLALEGDLPAVVGQQITRTAASGPAVDARIDALIAAASTPYPTKLLGADAARCDVIVKGVVAGEQVGGVLLAGGAVQPDDGGAPIAEPAFRALADAPGQALTYTCVPFGSGVRMGVDRDEDGVYDRVDVCPDVGDPGQADTDENGVGDACEPGVPRPTATPRATLTATPTTTPTPGPPPERVFVTRQLTAKRLDRPAGAQRVTLVSGDLDGAGRTFAPASEPLTVVLAVGGTPVATATIPAGDPDWRTAGGGRRFRWRARTAPHPAGLRTVQLGTAGGPFRVKLGWQDADAAGLAGAAPMTVTFIVGDDVWSGPTPPCTVSGDGASLRCR